MKNDKKNSFSFLVIILLCVSILGVLVFPSFSDRKEKEVVSGQKKYRSLVETANSGNWEISQVFKNTNNVLLSGLNKAYITSTSDDISENSVTIINTISLEKGSNIAKIDYGSFIYSIDISSLIKDGFNYDINMDDNCLEIYDVGGNLVADIKMGDVASDDYVWGNGLDASEYDLLWYYEDGLFIYSGKDIYPNDEFTKTFELTYELDYNTYKNVSMEIVTSLSFDADRIVDSEDSTVQMSFGDGQTSDPVVLENVVQNDSEVSKTWNNAWGTDPNEDYLYVLYDLEFDLTMDDDYDTLASLSLGDGVLMAYGDGTNYVVGGESSYINSTYSSLVNGHNHRTYVVGYEKPSSAGMITKEFSVDLIATGVYSETVDWTVNYDYQEEAVYPTANANEIDLEINNDNYGFGVINKLNDGKDVNFVYSVESVADTINNSYDGTLLKGFNNWYASNYGEDDYTAGLEFGNVYLSDTFGAGGTESKLGSGDYLISASEVMDDKEYDYALDSTNVIYYLTNANISDYGNKKVYVKTGTDNNWTLVGTYKKDSNGDIDYDPVDSTTSYSAGKILLPNNTVQVKVEYTGKRAAVYVGYKVYVTLLHSNNVKDIVNNNDNTYIKTTAESKDDTKSDYHKLTELSYTSALLVNNTGSTLNGDTNVITYRADFSKRISYQSGESELVREVLSEEQEGDFYFLLPQGAVLDAVTSVNGYGSVTVDKTVTQIENYNNTNRTLVKVQLVNGTGNYSDSDNKISTGYRVNITINYSQVANRDYGNTLYLDTMYVSGGELSDGYTSASELANGVLTSTEAKTTLGTIETRAGKNKLFKGNTVVITAVTVTSGQAEARVKTLGMNDYGAEATIKESYPYSYQLEYTYSDPLLNFDHVVFYDALDTAYGSNEYVKGTFDSVDTNYLVNNLGIRPTIYYSTKATINLDTDTDLTNENVWSVDLPSDKTKVTAVAVDLGSYTFSGQDRKIPMVYINMIGSNNYTKENVYAYNNVLVKYNDLYSGTTKTSTSTTTRVKLEKAQIDLDLNVKQDINGGALVSGTESSPARVESNYGYLYTLTNRDTVNDYHNISITSVISDGITIDSNNISYYDVIANNKLISEDNMVSYSYDALNKSITLNVSELDKNSSINIWIPVNVNMETLTSDDALITNSAMISRLEGTAYRGDTLNTYNTVAIPQVEGSKFIKNGGVFVTTDQEALKVSRGGSYTYMVKVSNNSDVVATNITVVDNIPNGLNVNTSSIDNGGVYSNNTVTWNVASLGARESIELTYNASIPTNIANNTRYSSSAHVTVVNPFNTANNIYDEDTNTIVVVYSSAADIVVNNKVSGVIVNNDKVFNYSVTLNGHNYDAGQYSITDSSNNEITKITIDSTGRGSANIELTNGNKFTVRNLPGDVSYVIAINNESGYTTLEDNNVLTESGNASYLTGTTSDGSVDTYTFNNTYYAEGYYYPVAKMTYDGTYSAGDFMFKVNGTDYFSNANNDANDEIHFSQIKYVNKVGTYEYTVSQLDLGNTNIIYDDNVYKMYVSVTDNGDGTLNTLATYRDKYNNEVDEIIFENKEIPVGLLIRNKYVGDYVQEGKTFDYEIEVTNSVDGSYDILNNNSEKVGTFEVQNGTGTYEVSLGDSQYILIKNLPENSDYVVKMKLQDYYESNTTGGSETNGDLVVTGTMGMTTSEVVYENSYSTSANYKPVVNVILNEKELQDSEFVFKIVDVSETANGYTDSANNNVDGVIEFNNISFNRPGTYKYEIRQVKGTSDKIYYDESPVLLTLVLTDNGDNTMSVDASYTFVEGRSAFVNTYVPNGVNYNPNTGSEGTSGIGNPNTIDYVAGIIIILLVAIAGIITVRVLKYRKYAN